MPTIELPAARAALEANRDLLHSLPGVWGSGIARVGRGYRVRLLVHSKPQRDPHTPHFAIPTRLEAFIDLLDDGQPANDPAAAALLESFIRTVERERGDRIEEEAAVTLIPAATNLLTLLE